MRINDDYCDCADGSDEPGTSACSNGFFYCKNSPHKPTRISSALVDDNICDCCDGSDEAGYCEDVCAKVSATEQNAAKLRAQAIRSGVKSRISLEDTARKNLAKDQKELALKEKIELGELKKSVDTAKRHEEDLKIFQKSTKSNRIFRKSTKSDDEEEKDAADDDHVDVSGDRDMHNDIDGDEEYSNPNAFEPTETEGGSDESVQGGVSDDAPEEVVPPEHKQEGEAGGDDAKDAVPNVIDIESVCQEIIAGGGKWKPVKRLYISAVVLLKTFVPGFLKYSEPTQLSECISRAESTRMDAESTLRTLEGEIEALKTKIARGIQPLAGNCIKKNINKYEWEHCPYEEVKQYEHGRYIASLGSYITSEGALMVYKDGGNCWNGPNRSVNVTLICGSHNDILSVDEPNRCEYVMKFVTPAVCTEEEARKVLRDAGINEESSNQESQEKEEL